MTDAPNEGDLTEQELTDVELLVVGAGPGGLCAAIEAVRAGVDVVVLDDNPRPGGQIYRQMPASFTREGGARRGSAHDEGARQGFGHGASTRSGKKVRAGQALLDEARAAGVVVSSGSTAWAMFDPGVLEVVTGDRNHRVRAQRLVLATGAYDRPVPLPGWTLPGVFTVGGAQGLLKSQRLLVGQRVLVAGVGPLLLVVAGQLAEAGAEIVAVVEPVSRLDTLGLLPALLREWRITREGLGHRWSLARRRVPWLGRSMLVRVEGEENVERAVVADVDSDWQVVPDSTRTFEVDAVCLGYGLVPSVELATICGCPLRFAPETRSWVPARGADLQSGAPGAPGIFVVGDCAGILGAQAAAVEGRIAGLTIARDLKRLEPARADRLLQPYLERRAELERFGHALHRAFELRPGLTSLAEADTVVCRCEEVTLAEVDEAIDEGADTPGQLKAWTRAGMGSCQGRMCASFLMERLASRLGRSLEEVGYLRTGAPAKPIISLESVSRQ